MPDYPDAAWSHVSDEPSGWWRRFTASLPMRTALLAVAAVWVLGAVWSFQEQTAFAIAKGFAFPHLLPLVIDGFAIAMAGVAWAASLDARPAVAARLATVVAVGASSTSNGAWAYLRTEHDLVAVLLGVAVPLAANLAFEVLLSELRRQVQRRRGLPPPVAIPYPRLIRLALSPFRTFAEWRVMVLELTAMEHSVAPRPIAPAAEPAPSPVPSIAGTAVAEQVPSTRPASPAGRAPSVGPPWLGSAQLPAVTVPTTGTPSTGTPITGGPTADGPAAEGPPAIPGAAEAPATERLTTTPAADTERVTTPAAATERLTEPAAATERTTEPTVAERIPTMPPAAPDLAPTIDPRPASAVATRPRRSPEPATPRTPAVRPAAPAPGPAPAGRRMPTGQPDRPAARRVTEVPPADTARRDRRRAVDPRVELLARHLAAIEDAGEFTGDMVGPLLQIDVAPRTGRRLLGQARELLTERARLETNQPDLGLRVIGGR